MLVTVAICTWNRAKLLDQTLAEMQKLVIPEGVEWELIVVNNNSTDDTEAVLARHADKLPLRGLLETKQGHSHARNCAIEAARGELLIWTDDDVLVDPQWLNEYVKAARQWPEAAVFGGTIDPWFEVDPPAWFLRNWNVAQSAFVVRQYGREMRPLAPHEGPAGANMAFRMADMRAFEFDTSLGRFRDTLTGGDDDNVIRRMRAAGRQGVWVGTAVVKHFLPTERLTRKYLARWFVGAGMTQVRMKGTPPGATLWGMPRWAIRKYITCWIAMAALEPFRSAAWMTVFRQTKILEGFLIETRRRSSKAAAQLAYGK